MLACKTAVGMDTLKLFQACSGALHHIFKSGMVNSILVEVEAGKGQTGM